MAMFKEAPVKGFARSISPTHERMHDCKTGAAPLQTSMRVAPVVRHNIESSKDETSGQEATREVGRTNAFKLENSACQWNGRAD